MLVKGITRPAQTGGITLPPKGTCLSDSTESLQLATACGCFTRDPHLHFKTQFKLRGYLSNPFEPPPDGGQTLALSTAEHTESTEPVPQC